MNLGARMAAWSGEKLPYLRRVRFLTNTAGGSNTFGVGGTYRGSYIDLGIHPDPSSVLTMDFILDSSFDADYKCLFGGYDANSKNFGVVISGSDAYCLLGYQSKKTISLTSGTNRIKLDARNSTITVNESATIALSHSLTATSSLNLYLFNDNAVNGMGTYNLSYNFKGSIEGVKYESDTRNLNLIPVVKSINGVETGFMYDTIGKDFFGNVGIGAFTWGELT